MVDPASIWNSVLVASNVASIDMPNSDSDRDIAGVADTGFGAVRIPVEWSEIEPVEGQFDWTEIDSEINSAATRGLPVLGVLTWTPTWAVPANSIPVNHPAPAAASRFAQFAEVAAARYRNRVTAWEVWNEPNIAASFGPRADPILYCSILSQTSVAIRRAAPGTLVITGPTSPTIDSDRDVSPATFVDSLYRCAGTQTFDAVAMHPYSSPDLLSEPGPGSSSLKDIAGVRAVMEQHGDGDKKIWFTEFGAPTMATSPGVSEERQAAILVDGITGMRQLPYAGPVFAFDYRDSDTGNPVQDYNYGLLRSDYTPKLSFAAVKDLLG